MTKPLGVRNVTPQLAYKSADTHSNRCVMCDNDCRRKTERQASANSTVTSRPYAVSQSIAACHVTRPVIDGLLTSWLSS